MKLSSLLLINAIIGIIFGIAFVLFPGQIYTLHNVEVSPQLNYMGQFFGAALITLGILSWFARNLVSVDALKVIVLAFLIGDIIGFIVALIGQLSNVVNDLGWLNVLIYLLLSLGFSYFQFKKVAHVKTV